MKVIKLASILLISLLGAFFFSACSTDDDTTEVRLAEVTRSIFYAPQYVALSQGFFEEEGLDVELTTTWGGDTTMTTLLSDGADVALVGAETSIYVYAQEANDPAINFAQLTQTDGTFLVSREPIEDFEWDDLKGSTFLGQRAGGMPQMVGEYVLKQNGIDPHEDLEELIQNIDFGNIPSAFASGTGDFVQLFEPQATQFEEDGLGYIIDSFGTQSGNIPYTVYMAKESYLNDNEETVEKFTRAIQKAQVWVQEQPADVVAEAIADYFEDTSLEVIEQVVERYRDQGSYAETPLLQEEAWYLLQEIMNEAGELPQEISYEELVNTDIPTKIMNE
ncbi:ABC transporter substrate-binding protein [Bacillus alkalicola]|uniref:ABC transporter substrate-binding protein n=1 Tax=Evansella alkalicola TaxID=745819 RepID=A0ABS6JR77_9BACI|nr:MULTISPECIES: ABC transporter substrate-binding protein [Bacillaceae]MBU9721040.1 ABC transporter substrate-binding protein [Bacillus alkalicola]